LARSTCDMFFFRRNFLRFSPSFFADDINGLYSKLHHITTCNIIHIGHVRPEFRQKKTDGASGGFLPRPLLLRLRNPKLAEVLRKPYPQKIASAKPSPHCIRASVLFLLEKLCASHRGASAQRMHD
jgi:hypothetical protein